jgi:tetratricopeptide (TPR) repeat protein
MGRFDEAEALVQKAHRWNPQWTFYHLFMGQLRYEQGDYRQAIAELKRYPWLNEDITGLLWQAVSFAELGENDQAHALIPAMQKIDPDISLKTVVRFLPYQHQERLDRTLASLRKAGLPE